MCKDISVARKSACAGPSSMSIKLNSYTSVHEWDWLPESQRFLSTRVGGGEESMVHHCYMQDALKQHAIASGGS